MKHMRDEDIQKGAVEQESPTEHGNTSLAGQLPHRTENPLVKNSDTDFPEPGPSPEHSGQHKASSPTDRDAACEPSSSRGAGTRQDDSQRQPRDKKTGSNAA